MPQEQNTLADKIAAEVAAMDRKAVIAELSNFRAGFPLDFTQEFLESLSDGRLKHILLAARIQASKSNNDEQQTV